MKISDNKRIRALIDRIGHFGKQVRFLSLYLSATIVTSVIGILINPFLASNLSPEDYAIIGYFTSFNTLVLPIISFSLISYYSKNYFRIKEEERQNVLDTLLLSQLFIGFGLLIFIYLGFYLYMKIVNVKFPFYPFAILGFLSVFFNCFYNLLLVDLRMKRDAHAFFRIVVIHSILGACFSIFLVVILKKGAIGRFWAIVLPALLLGVYSFKKLISKFNFNKTILKDALNFGWPISLSAILYYFLTGVDRAMLERLNDTTTFGIYNVAAQITGYLFVFYTAIKQTFEPDIFRAVAINNKNQLIKIVLGIITLNAIPSILFILFAYPVIDILTAGRYIESTSFARILAIKNIPMSFCFMVSSVIIAYGYPKIELLNRIVGAILSVILFKILIDRYAFFGAAWGQSVVFILMTLISFSFIIFKYLSNNKRK